MNVLANQLSTYGSALDSRDAELVSSCSVAAATSFVCSRPGYAPTPLVALEGLARELGVGAIHVKDESGRLGLQSFKALGGSFAVAQLTAERAAESLRRAVSLHDLRRDEVREIASKLRFACATDGNHGVAVAFGASLVGAACTVFLHSGVSDARADAITAWGAELKRVQGNYDDAVAEATRWCARYGWTEVADTARPRYERIPSLVMQGYSVLLAEAEKQLQQPPTHIFVQAGVGGFAGTLAAQSVVMFGPQRPTFIVVEPAQAACLAASLKAECSTRIASDEPTIMVMLECYEPSLIAWRILSRAADFFMTIGDEDAIFAMNRLARPTGGDAALVVGESGAAGLGGLLRAAASEKTRAQIGLNPTSRILVIATEGATDSECYRASVGLQPNDVRELASHG